MGPPVVVPLGARVVAEVPGWAPAGLAGASRQVGMHVPAKDQSRMEHGVLGRDPLAPELDLAFIEGGAVMGVMPSVILVDDAVRAGAVLRASGGEVPRGSPPPPPAPPPLELAHEFGDAFRAAAGELPPEWARVKTLFCRVSIAETDGLTLDMDKPSNVAPKGLLRPPA